MKVWLDDNRNAPDKTWVIARNVEDCIKLIDTGFVTEISFDHDLGEPEPNNGYRVICHLEVAVYRGYIKKPIVHIHTNNASVLTKMNQTKRSIEQYENPE